MRFKPIRIEIFEDGEIAFYTGKVDEDHWPETVKIILDKKQINFLIQELNKTKQK